MRHSDRTRAWPHPALAGCACACGRLTQPRWAPRAARRPARAAMARVRAGAGRSAMPSRG